MVFPLGPERETVNVAVVVVLPSVSVTVTSFIETEGAASLSVIVAIPWASAIEALTSEPRFT